MGRGNKQIDGQLELNLIDMDPNKYVVQSNILINSKQSLKRLNSVKLMRAVIMQIIKEDEKFKTYKITVNELAELLQVNPSNLYRDIPDMVDDLLSSRVYICVKDGKRAKGIGFPWVQKVQYDTDIGIQIKINDELKPFLIGLEKEYNQYVLMDILSMTSVYGIRLYEIITSRIMNPLIPKNGTEIYLTLDEIRILCDCEDEKHDTFSNLRKNVIDVGLKEINEHTLYKVWYDKTDYVKSGKSVIGIKFHIGRFRNWGKLSKENE